MKTKTHKNKKPFHLHLEYFFRMRVCLLLAIALLAMAFMKGDRSVIAAVPQAYAEGSSKIGAHMSEERLHPHPALHILRPPTTSSGK